MNPISRLAITPILISLAFAQGPKGTEPRQDATKYPAHAMVGGVSIGASLLSAEDVHNMFVSDVSKCCLVVEIAVYPPKDKPLNVSLNDLALRLGGDSALKPSSVKIVAAGIQTKSGSGRDVTVTPTHSINYDTGRGYDPVTGQAAGVTDTSGVIVGIGRGESNASRDKDRITMETELNEKALPAGLATEPIAGYVYFAVSPKKKLPMHQLEYKIGNAKAVLSLQ